MGSRIHDPTDVRHVAVVGAQWERDFRYWRRSLPAQLQRWQVGRVLSRLDVAAALEACSRQPVYSLVVPVFRTDRRWLRRCIQSVRDQFYRQWELLLVDDGSQQPELTAELHRWAERDERIRTFALPTNQGISAATNRGLAETRGAFVGFLDHDDELTPDALLWMAVAHNCQPQAAGSILMKPRWK